MAHPNELPNIVNPFDEGYKWYCPTCQILLPDEFVGYENIHSPCRGYAKLLNPNEQIVLADAGIIVLEDIGELEL